MTKLSVSGQTSQQVTQLGDVALKFCRTLVLGVVAGNQGAHVVDDSPCRLEVYAAVRRSRVLKLESSLAPSR